jgi:CheY-like chemotaxis protein
MSVVSPTRLTILCVDDQLPALVGRKTLLEQNGYRVLSSTDCAEGLNLFCAHTVHAVILDYQMPGATGDMVATKMKSLKAEVPILLLSSYGPLPPKKLRSVDMLLLKSEAPKLLVGALRKILVRHKPFFQRWFDDWRFHNRTVLP